MAGEFVEKVPWSVGGGAGIPSDEFQNHFCGQISSRSAWLEELMGQWDICFFLIIIICLVCGVVDGCVEETWKAGKT